MDRLDIETGQRTRVFDAPADAYEQFVTALDDEGQRLFEGLLGDHIAGGGMAIIATHHPLAPAPARELRLGA